MTDPADRPEVTVTKGTQPPLVAFVPHIQGNSAGRPHPIQDRRQDNLIRLLDLTQHDHPSPVRQQTTLQPDELHYGSAEFTLKP